MIRIRARAGRTKRVIGEMNANERRYAQQLDAWKTSGEVLEWHYEAVNLRLANNTYYRPDFMVIWSDLTVEFHEVKGAKKIKTGARAGETGYWCEEAGKAKVKIAAAMYPFVFKIVFQSPGGWIGEEI